MKKIIEINQSDYVQLFLDNIIIKRDIEKFVIPINTVDVVIFENDRTTITIPLINELVKKKVNIIICKNHLPNSLIIPYNGYYNNKIFQNQIKWSLKYKGQTWKKIIRLKIQRSLDTLVEKKLVSTEIEEKMTSYIDQVEDHDVTNREGHVAKLYFKHLFGENFIRDQKADDRVNSLLNYGYTVLLSYVARIICAKGMDNRLSLYHKSFNNNFPLACDLMEPYRFWIDQIVFDHINKKFFLFQEFKEDLFTSFNKHITYKNKKIRFKKFIDAEISEILELDKNAD
ncbi:type II CRISPR-associated endonuclease Cas1 [Mycoplasma sp. 'Moose RK']|uniref:type II CRISPR-associated endonuclease Cas1 n=1 Tax=Mycoplasma sp. 'Moose RK' TaxID=2780095 RepID=UPI0018C25226|nr:type II CRISPR-associated endonuclease Cas1 [Mycoplasma sp. 'Moose RK']MBG0730785.1 type II CRISPR-associated endonuclease Cas1 [Mycoplasma sp. 'Moose RK']